MTTTGTYSCLFLLFWNWGIFGEFQKLNFSQNLLKILYFLKKKLINILINIIKLLKFSVSFVQFVE